MNDSDTLTIGDPVAIRVDGSIVDATVTEVVASDLHDIDTYIVQVGNDTYPIYADEVLVLSFAS